MTGEPATFGTMLRRQRLAAGVTQEQLAELAGLSVRGIQDLERGARRVPHAETVRRLATALERLDAGPPALVLARRAAESRLTPERRPLPLSMPLSSFVGREEAVGEVASRLERARLLTLTGSGGIGKTRLALAVASNLAAQSAAEVYFADLSPLVDADLVVECVATALGLREQLVRPLVDTICDAAADEPTLLVLDNCEHVLAACVTLVDTLLRRCPKLRILATSREPLHMSGETVWRVPPLSAAGAARLFVDRAAAAGSGVELTDRARQSIADICRRLDGVPLAIELAAARTSMFSVEQIVERLDDACRLLSRGSRTSPARHQTLRATIEWSYGQLTQPEQMLLERLSVFAGGCAFDALEAVAGDKSPDAPDVLDLLGRLVDKSLVVAEPSADGSLRYRLQEVVRQFSHQRLSAHGNMDAVRGLHAGYFLQLLRDVETRALTVDRRAALDRVELELDNCRAARRWYARHRDGKAAQRFESALYRTLMYRGHATEGRASLLDALALPGGSLNTRARVLGCLSALAIVQADYALAHDYGEQSLTLRRQMADPTGLAYAFIELGMIAAMRGEFTTAAHRLGEARQASLKSGHGYLVGFSLAVSGHMEYLHGDFDAAVRHAYAAIEVDGARGFKSPTCMALTTLGNVSYLAGNSAAASRSLRAALAKAEELDETYLIFRAALGLAVVAADECDVAGARSLLDVSLRRALEAGNRHQVAQALEGVANFAATQGDLDAALRFAEIATGIRATIGAPLSPTEARILTTVLGPPRQSAPVAWELEATAAAAQAYLTT